MIKRADNIQPFFDKKYKTVLTDTNICDKISFDI